MVNSSFVKRSFDILVSSLGIIVLSPLFILLSLYIKLSDRGEIFFIQKRTGRKGIPFYLYKFRSMTPSDKQADGLFEPGKISRITPTGKFLRRTKLDELPQLINVLKGDMSLVGPRPEVEKWVNVYPEKWKGILTVRPGITDNASLEFRDEEKLLAESSDPEGSYLNEILPRKLDLSLSYVENRTFSGDIRIILQTINAILFR